MIKWGMFYIFCIIAGLTYPYSIASAEVYQPSVLSGEVRHKPEVVAAPHPKQWIADLRSMWYATRKHRTYVLNVFECGKHTKQDIRTAIGVLGGAKISLLKPSRTTSGYIVIYKDVAPYNFGFKQRRIKFRCHHSGR